MLRSFGIAFFRANTERIPFTGTSSGSGISDTSFFTASEGSLFPVRSVRKGFVFNAQMTTTTEDTLTVFELVSSSELSSLTPTKSSYIVGTVIELSR